MKATIETLEFPCEKTKNFFNIKNTTKKEELAIGFFYEVLKILEKIFY